MRNPELTGAPLRVAPRALTSGLLWVVAFFAVVHFVGLWLVFHGGPGFEGRFDDFELMNMDESLSLPTWVQQLVLFLCAVVAGAIAWLTSPFGSGRRKHWLGLGIILALMSLDEAAEIHSRYMDPLRSLFDIQSGIFWFAWIIPALVLLALFAVAYLRFWAALPPAPRGWIGVGGGLFVIGALGMEMIGGSHRDSGTVDYAYAVIVGIEETLEMVGAVFVLRGLLLMLQQATAGGALTVELAELDR